MTMPSNFVSHAGDEALHERVARLERELAAARERLRQLEEIERIQTNFAFAISHELRTPLTLISGYAQKLLLRWGVIDEDRRRGMVEKINISSHRLSRLVNDILLITDVERGDLSMHIRMVAVPEVAREALRELGDRYPGGLPKLHVTGPDVTARSDGFRLEQALICVLDNAVKHAPPGSIVTLAWHRVDRQVVIRVADQGRGIHPDDVPKLFTRFGRLEHTIGQSRGGVGLGLYIAKCLVEAMGGAIWAESTPGVGSTFFVAVPADDGEM